MSSFTDHLAIEQLPGGKLWRILRDLVYFAGSEDSEEAYLVPLGFITDGGSIPPWLWWALGHPLGPAAPAYALHDWLYRTRGLTMEELLADGDYLSDVALLAGALHTDEQDWTGPKGSMTQARADALLREGMACLGIAAWKRWTVWSGLRLGGWAAWNRYRRDQEKAEAVPAPT